MNYKFGFWELEVDVDATKRLYQTNDYASDKKANEEFKNGLSTKQLDFFNSLAIDLDKISIDIKEYDVTEEDLSKKSIKRIAINFLMKGEILALPKFQYDIYADKEINDLDFPENINVTTTNDRLVSYYLDGLHIIFKHPYFHFEDAIYKKWNAGYILGTILIINDED